MIDPHRPPAAAALLAGPALAYRAAVALRNALYDAEILRPRRLPCAVISIGNLTVGGTGKTPLTGRLAMLLRDAGFRPGIASRGYRRRSGPAPILVSDGRSILADPDAAGDEPGLLARDHPAVPIAVGADRAAAGRLLLGAGCDVVLLDDGYQHRRLARDLDLLLVDGRDPWGNGKMLPRGPLREPLSSLARADAILVTRCHGRAPDVLMEALGRHNPAAPVFLTRVRARGFTRSDAESVGPSALKGLSAYAFSGIARPERFEDDLRALGVRLAGSRRFPDHHRYSARELEEVARAGRSVTAEVLVTTEKDQMRIASLPEGAPPLYALAQEVEFAEGSGLQAFVLKRLATRGAARAAS
jgi:tetraacyldisaccharide 4'-kinase